MNNNDEIIDRYLEKPYWVIDILPKQVPADCGGQYFKIEKHFLSQPQMEPLLQKFTNILLKLNCYEDIDVCHFVGDPTVAGAEQWVENPAPEELEMWVKERKPLFFLMESQDAMISLAGDDTYMTLYNPNVELLELVRSLAASEGLFVWKPKQQD